MQVTKRKGGGERRGPPRRRLPVNPFGQVGSPIRDLISAAEWDGRYDGIKAELMEAAKVEPGSIVPGRRPVSRQRWFAANVKRTVKSWLELAGQPAVREVAEELGELYTRLWDALTLKTPEAVAAAADAYEALSPPARDALRRHDQPSPEAIRDGDAAALQLLFGLVPIALGPSLDVHRLFAAGAEYLGPGSGELHLPGRGSSSSSTGSRSFMSWRRIAGPRWVSVPRSQPSLACCCVFWAIATSASAAIAPSGAQSSGASHGISGTIGRNSSAIGFCLSPGDSTSGAMTGPSGT